MEEAEHSVLARRYQGLSADELLTLHERRSELQPAALLALDQEVSRRREVFAAAKEARMSDAAADRAWEAKQIKAELRREAREHRFLNWGMIVATPFCAWWFVIEPPLSLGELRSSKTVLAVAIVGWWVMTLVRYRQSAKKGGASDA